MAQHPSALLNADNAFVEETIRFRGALTDEAAESSDGSWEDEDNSVEQPINAGLRHPSSPASASATSARQTPKRKRGRARLTTNRRNDYIDHDASLPTSPFPKSPRPKRKSYTLPSADILLDGAKDISIFTIRYVWDISSRALHHSRFMFGVLLASWIIALITLQILPTLWGVVSPVCYLPLVSSSNMCEVWRNTLPGKKALRWADYPKMVNLQSKTFEQLMDESIGGSALSLEVKKAEMAITDLVSFVQLSKLKAKDTLASSLSEFVLDAKRTGRGLQRLSSKIGGAVDK